VSDNSKNAINYANKVNPSRNLMGGVIHGPDDFNSEGGDDIAADKNDPAGFVGTFGCNGCFPFIATFLAGICCRRLVGMAALFVCECCFLLSFGAHWTQESRWWKGSL
jgi:hypothetical protein